MKSKLIIANWLFALLLITYSGDSLILTFAVAAYFCYSCTLLTRHQKEVDREVNEMENKIDLLTSNLKT